MGRLRHGCRRAGSTPLSGSYCGDSPETRGLTENAGHEIAGHENAGHEFARQDKYRIKIDYITLECVFLSKFKYFLCKASVLTYKKNLTAPAHHKYSSVLLSVYTVGLL